MHVGKHMSACLGLTVAASRLQAHCCLTAAATKLLHTISRARGQDPRLHRRTHYVLQSTAGIRPAGRRLRSENHPIAALTYLSSHFTEWSRYYIYRAVQKGVRRGLGHTHTAPWSAHKTVYMSLLTEGCFTQLSGKQPSIWRDCLR